MPSKASSAPRQRVDSIAGTILSHPFTNVPIHLPLATPTCPSDLGALNGLCFHTMALSLSWTTVREGTYGGWLEKAKGH